MVPQTTTNLALLVLASIWMVAAVKGQSLDELSQASALLENFDNGRSHHLLRFGRSTGPDPHHSRQRRQPLKTIRRRENTDALSEFLVRPGKRDVVKRSADDYAQYKRGMDMLTRQLRSMDDMYTRQVKRSGLKGMYTRQMRGMENMLTRQLRSNLYTRMVKRGGGGPLEEIYTRQTNGNQDGIGKRSFGNDMLTRQLKRDFLTRPIRSSPKEGNYWLHPKRMMENFLARPGKRSLDDFLTRPGKRSLDDFLTRPGKRNLDDFLTRPGKRGLDDFLTRPGKRSLDDFLTRPGKRSLDDFLTRPGKRDLDSFLTRPGKKSLDDFLTRPGKRELDDFLTRPTRDGEEVMLVAEPDEGEEDEEEEQEF